MADTDENLQKLVNMARENDSLDEYLDNRLDQTEVQLRDYLIKLTTFKQLRIMKYGRP